MEKITGFLQSKDKNGKHRPEAIGEAVIVAKAGDNDYIVKTEDGVCCHALFNWFCGMWFIDDVYTVVNVG